MKRPKSPELSATHIAKEDEKGTLIYAIARIGYSDEFGQPSNLLRTDCGGISLFAEEI
jgi:hypothetical protein